MARSYSFPTVETVLDQAVSEALGSSTSALTANQTIALVRRLDVINKDFIASSRTGWSWMQAVTNFQTKSSTTLSGAITTASLTFGVASDIGFDATGRVWIKTSKGAIDFIDTTFTGTTHTVSTATGRDGIDIGHASGEKVEKLYAVPSDYARAKSLILDTIPYSYIHQDRLPVHATYYTRGPYLVLPESVGQTDATLWYEKSATDLSTGEDEDLQLSLDIPENYMWYAVYRLMAYIQRNRRKRDDARESLELARLELEKALNDDVSETSSQSLTTDY